MKKIEACIFDLDGVIVDTAKYHYIFWRKGCLVYGGGYYFIILFFNSNKSLRRSFKFLTLP